MIAHTGIRATFSGTPMAIKTFSVIYCMKKLIAWQIEKRTPFFEIDFCFERIVIGQEEVAGEADNESGCKRYIDIEIHIQHGIIYAV